MLRLVAAGIGIAILPAMVVKDADPSRIAVRQVQPRLTRALVIARRRDRYFGAAASEFTSYLKDAAARGTGD
jgi:DNA-binding transcriptional LysR family regulator